jgi:hypothetical protein
MRGLTHLFLVDPVVGGLLPALELLGLEPEGDLLLGGLDGVGAVADVAADVLVREEKLVELFPLERGFVASDGNL